MGKSLEHEIDNIKSNKASKYEGKNSSKAGKYQNKANSTTSVVWVVAFITVLVLVLMLWYYFKREAMPCP